MEYAIHLQGARHLFYGSRPKNLDEARRKFYICVGDSVVDAGKKNGKRRKTERPFRHVSLVQQLFFDQTVNHLIIKPEQHEDPFLKHIVDFLSNRKLDEQVEEDLFTQGVAPVPIANAGSVPFETTLLVLKRWLRSDRPKLYFDWFQLQYICTDIWQKIWHSTGRKHMNFKNLASAALKEASESKRRGECVEAPLLRSMWDTLQDYIFKEARPGSGKEPWVADSCSEWSRGVAFTDVVCTRIGRVLRINRHRNYTKDEASPELSKYSSGYIAKYIWGKSTTSGA